MLIFQIILIVLLSLAGVVVLTLVSFLILGRFLRKEYAGKVDATLDRPIEDVWQAILDFQSNPVSAKMCRSVTSEVRDGQEWSVEDLGSSQVSVRVTARSEQESITRKMQDNRIPMEAECKIELESTGEGCRVIASNRISVHDGSWQVPMIRSMLFLFGLASKGMKAYVTQLAHNLETKPEFNRA